MPLFPVPAEVNTRQPVLLQGPPEEEVWVLLPPERSAFRSGLRANPVEAADHSEKPLPSEAQGMQKSSPR